MKKALAQKDNDCLFNKVCRTATSTLLLYGGQKTNRKNRPSSFAVEAKVLQFDPQFIKLHLWLNHEFPDRKVSTQHTDVVLSFYHWRNVMSAFIAGSSDSRATLIFSSVASKIQCFGVEVQKCF